MTKFLLKFFLHLFLFCGVQWVLYVKMRGQVTQVSSFLSWVDNCIYKLGFMPAMVKVGKISCLVPPSLLDRKLLEEKDCVLLGSPHYSFCWECEKYLLNIRMEKYNFLLADPYHNMVQKLEFPQNPKKILWDKS